MNNAQQRRALAPEQRRRLERTTVEARQAAETAVRSALETLAVHHGEPWPHMDEAAREFRRRLRAHGRQLGDRRDRKDNTQSIDWLAAECAYEQWHGMLFARFLAENDLLIEPKYAVPVTLEECEELGRERSVDKWALAAQFAHEMLPQVFRLDHPAFDLEPAPEHRLRLEKLLEDLPTDVFQATDALGWVYQFWQSEEKKRVNASGKKIGAEQLSAVTQLFTEPYMVHFLLDNTLGAWWAAERLPRGDLESATTEEELRQQAAIPGVPLDYLRFVQTEDGEGWSLAGGSFDDWPERLGDFKVLDPCCGSGHFLVAAFAMLVPMRMEREGLAAGEAVDAVLRDNVHGLELDSRCVEIAAFALALTAWTWPGAEGYRPLPKLNIACSGLAVSDTKATWTALAGDNHNLRLALGWLHDTFKDAPTLGSLLDPAGSEAGRLGVDWHDVEAALDAALTSDATVAQHETAIAAQGMARAAEMLSSQFHLVATNVPYLARGKQNDRLKDYCAKHHKVAKNDLATVFLERCLDLCTAGGAASLVLPQNWLFLTSYRKLREKLLQNETWRLVGRLGPKGFQTPMWDFNVQLLVLSRGQVLSRSLDALGESVDSSIMHGLDVSSAPSAPEKGDRLTTAPIQGIKQAQQLENPDARITIEAQVSSSLLGDFADALVGLQTSDDPMFIIGYWELGWPNTTIWEYLQGTPDSLSKTDGMSWLARWEQGAGSLLSLPSARATQGLKAVGKPGVAIHRMQTLFAYRYSKERFHQNVAVILPKSDDNLVAVWCFCSSPEYNDAVRRIDQKLNVTNATLTKVPFDLDHWTTVAEERYPNGLPQPYSDDPTQWIFHGHPCGSVIWDEDAKRLAHGPLRTDQTVLHVAVARLLGYRWPAERDADMELAPEQREWVSRCEALQELADRDGIVCISAVRGELPAADRLLPLLTAAYGDDWEDALLPRMLDSAGSANLDDWLRNAFFEQHCKLFHHRPFIWHVWDGRKLDGFHALVNYHRLAGQDGTGRRCLEALTYSYLGDWISRQRDGVQREIEGADGRLAAALKLQERLEAILDGERPFDIFVRWKPLAAQAIGWEPDIDDGVRLNIRPFLAEDIPGGRKGSGILRFKPNVHWRKDRGKEPHRDAEAFPWFWRDGEFTAVRVNDTNLTLAEKRAARSRAVE